MIRALFVYRYCGRGGVEAALRLRVTNLPLHGIEAHALFLHDANGSRDYRRLEGRVFFQAGEPAFAELLRSRRYEVISLIDTFEVLDWIQAVAYEGAVIAELQSTYPEALAELHRLSSRRLGALLVPSRFQADWVRRHLDRSVRERLGIHVVPNFVDPGEFFPVSATTPPTGPKIVGWIGQLDRLKNWRAFLDVADRLADRGDVEFWVVGGGASSEDSRRSFRLRVCNSRLATTLRWWPSVPHRTMPLVYHLIAASGGVATLTTRCESFGLAALEAMASGCPVVAPRVGALPELIEHGVTGLLYRAQDTRRAARFVAMLLDHEDLRRELASRAAARAIASFAPGRCAAILADVVQSVAGAHLGASSSAVACKAQRSPVTERLPA